MDECWDRLTGCFAFEFPPQFEQTFDIRSEIGLFFALTFSANDQPETLGANRRHQFPEPFSLSPVRNPFGNPHKVIIGYHYQVPTGQ